MAELGQDLPLPMPCMFTQKPLCTPSGLPPGLAVTLVHACMGHKESVCTQACEPLDDPHSVSEGHLCTAGLTPNRVDHRSAWGLGTCPSETHTTLRVDMVTACECTHSIGFSHTFRTHTHTHSTPTGTHGDGHPHGYGRAHSSCCPRLRAGQWVKQGGWGSRAATRAGCPPCWPSGSAHGRQPCLPPSNTGWAPPL